ncbi:MAG: phage tail tape measure protein, partial [Clostridiales bacterium]|nr:phage tail tape measure protein [Clostridiales bacterium]
LEWEKAKTAVEKTEKALRDTNKELEKSQSGWHRVDQALGKAERKLTDWGQNISKVGRGLTLGLSVPTAAAGTAALKMAVDWETAMTGIDKTFSGTKQELEALEKELLKMATTDTPIDPKMLAEYAETAGQLGIYTENIAGFTKVIADMGVATNIVGSDGAESMAQYANVTGMAQEKFSNFGSTIVELGNKLATKEKPILDFSTNLASAGRQAGLTDDQILALGASAASLGLEASSGGNALSKVLLNMDKAVAKSGKELTQYAEISGVSAKDFAIAWEQDAAGAFTQFVTGLKGVEDAGGNVALTLEKLGYKEIYTSQALSRLAGNTGIMTKALSLASNAWEKNTALTKEASKINDTAAGRMQLLKNKAQVAGIELGKSMIPILNKMVDGAGNLVDKFAKMDDGQKELVLTLGAVAVGIGPVISGIGKVATGLGVLRGFLTGPGGIATLAIAGIGAIAYGISQIETPAEKLDKALKGLKVKVDKSELENLRDSMSSGFQAGEVAYEVKVKVQAEFEGLEEAVEEFTADGKITGGEKRSLRKYLKAFVEDPLEESKTVIEAKAEAYRTSLKGALDIDGNLLTDEQIETMVEAYRLKRSTAVTNLEAAYEDLRTLLAIVQEQGGSMTAKQIEEMEVLLEKIAEYRVALDLMNEDVMATVWAKRTKIDMKQGTAEDLQYVLNFEYAQYKKEMEEAQKNFDEIVKQAFESQDPQMLIDGQAAYDKRKKEAQGILTKETQGIVDAYMEAHPETKAAIEEILSKYDLLSIIQETENARLAGGIYSEEYS